MIITRKKGKGKEREAPTQMIKNSNLSHGSHVTTVLLDHDDASIRISGR